MMANSKNEQLPETEAEDSEPSFKRRKRMEDKFENELESNYIEQYSNGNGPKATEHTSEEALSAKEHGARRIKIGGGVRRAPPPGMPKAMEGKRRFKNQEAAKDAAVKVARRGKNETRVENAAPRAARGGEAGGGAGGGAGDGGGGGAGGWGLGAGASTRLEIGGRAYFFRCPVSFLIVVQYSMCRRSSIATRDDLMLS